MIAACAWTIIAQWRRNPLQLFTLVAGLAIATALWSGVQAINAEARASYDAAAATLGEGLFDQIVRADGQPTDIATFAELRRAGWNVSPVLEGRLKGVRLVGVEPLTAPGRLLPIATDGQEAFLADSGAVFGREDVGARLELPEFRVAPDIAPNTAIMDIGQAERLLDKPGEITRFIVGPGQSRNQAPLSNFPGLTLRAASGGSDISRLTDSFHLNLTAFGLLAFAVGIFIVHGAIGLAFEQRRGMIRTLRALGAPLATVLWVTGIELLVLAVLAGSLGVALGYVIAAALLPDVAATLRGLYGADVGSGLQLRPIWWASGLAVAVLGTAAASAGAFIQIARMPVLAAARPRAWAVMAGRDNAVRSYFAFGLLALAAVLAVAGSGLAAGFVLLGALLIGAALALPLVLAGLLHVAARLATAPLPQWFWADTRQQLPGLSLSLMALLLALSANIGVSTMVSSFRLTFAGFLDQRLSSELYLTADSPENATALVAFLTPKVEVVLPLMSERITLAGQPTDLYGYRDHRTYRENWRFLSAVDAPWDLAAAGKGILLNEQLARRAGLSVGQDIVLDGVTLTIAGIYGDYGNPIGQAVISETLFGQLYPDVRALRFGVRTDPAQVAALTTSLVDDFGLPAGNIVNQAGIKAFSMGVFERTFTVTGALNVLTLAVAGFAMLMSLLTLAGLRVPQLAPVWAMGVTRARLGQLELVRMVILALLTTVLAVPLGLALAWVLLSIVNVEAFGWQLPMFLFPADYGRLAIFALLAAGLAALWPALKLSRIPPGDLLKVFANER